MKEKVKVVVISRFRNPNMTKEEFKKAITKKAERIINREFEKEYKAKIQLIV